MRTVLVIDDEDAIVRFLILALSREGFKVDIAANGREGLEKVKAFPFDVVLTDIRMPLMDGNQLACQIRESIRSDTVLIGMTGTPGYVSSDKFDAVISKPFSIQTLLDAIDTRLGKPSKKSPSCSPTQKAVNAG
jgi:DNA-binding response OmpR family regulator